MDYNYPHERPENRSNQEAGQAHTSNQHLLHYQHQQYPPAHHAIQAGYPGLRLPPYMNPLQGPGIAPGLVHGQETGLVQPSRVPTSASAGSSSREAQGSHDFENVLTNVMQGSSVQGHYQQEPTPSHSQHGVPIQQILSSQQSPPIQPGGQIPSGSEAYHIEDLSHATQPSRMVTSTVGAPNTTSGGVAKSASRVVSSTGRTPKKRPAPASISTQPSKQASTGAAVSQIVTPQVCQQPQQLQRSRERISFSKHCQTDPLFQQVYNASMQFSKEGELPDGLEFVEDEKEEKITGVVATKDLEVGVEFGPFTGEFVKEGLGCFNPNTWEICVLGRTWYYIDGSKDPNNWMHHIRYARNTEEQNMEAFQVYGDIFFRLNKPVKAGTELRVFYSEEYCKHVGFKAHLDDLLYFIEAQRFECRDCDNRYTNSKSLFRHIKFEHDNENNVIPPAQMEPAVKKDPPKPKIPNLMTIKDVAAKMARDKALNAEKNKGKERTKVDKSKFLKVKLVPLGKSPPEETEDSFACKKCNKTFPSEGHLKQHAAFHKEMKDVRPLCDVCGLECKNALALKQHQLSHNPEALQCEICKKFFRRKGCLRYHLKHVHKKSLGDKWARGKIQEQMPRYVGPGEEDDDEEFHPELPKDMLESDQGSTTDEEQDDEEDQEDDEQVNDDDDPVDIQNDHDLNDNNNVQDNDETQDADQQENDEKIRKKPQVRIYDKKQQHSAQMSVNPDLVCKICGEEIKNKKVLQQHLLSHDPEAFQCKYCDWYFKRKSCMVFHLRTKHNVSMGRKWLRGTIEERIEKGSKPEEFPGEAILEEELRKQRREERIIKDPKGLRKKCMKCGKVCQNFNLWRQHMMSHNPDSLQCQECKWYFSRKSSLIYHLRSKHQIYVGEKYSRISKEELMLQDKQEEEEEDDGGLEEGEDDQMEEEEDGGIQEKEDGDLQKDDNGSMVEEDEDAGMVEEDEDEEVDKSRNGEEDEREEIPKTKLRAVDKKTISNGTDNFCNMCGLECENKRMLSQHLISHDSKALQCRLCKWFFRRRSCLASHLRHRHNVNIGKKWTKGVRKELMKYAIRAKDSRSAPNPPISEDVPETEANDDMDDSSVAALVYQCNFCPKKFSSGDFQLTHEMIVHINPTRYRCTVCHKSFQSRYALESHSQIHAQEKTYECAICNKKFNSNNTLVKHMLYHDVMENSELANVGGSADSASEAVESSS